MCLPNCFRIAVNLNVNHTVDSAEADDGTEEAPDMRSKPTFEVEITKPNGKTLAFTCSFIFDRDSAQEAAKDEGYGEKDQKYKLQAKSHQ